MKLSQQDVGGHLCSGVALRRLRLGLALAVCLLHLALAGTAYAAPSVTFVDDDAPGPSHNGASWATAYLTLQEALDVTNANGATDCEICCGESSPALTDVTISGNTAASDGGGLFNNGHFGANRSCDGEKLRHLSLRVVRCKC